MPALMSSLKFAEIVISVDTISKQLSNLDLSPVTLALDTFNTLTLVSLSGRISAERLDMTDEDMDTAASKDMKFTVRQLHAYKRSRKLTAKQQARMD